MADPNFNISTPRLYLSHLQPSLDTHCDFFVALVNSPEVLIANSGVASQIPDRETARKAIEAGAEQLGKTGYGKYVVSLKPTKDGEIEHDDRPFPERLKDCKFIGTVGLKLRTHPESPRVPDVGFSFLTPFWGKGFATEAVQALIGYYEKEKRQMDIFGYCSPTNENSKKMFRRLGFEERGVRLIKGLGGRPDEGIRGLVWAKKGMSEDLSEYGIGSE